VSLPFRCRFIQYSAGRPGLQAGRIIPLVEIKVSKQ
jgi:hypothetical protein